MPATPLERYVRGVVGPCRVVARHRTSGPSRVIEVRDHAQRHWFGKRIHFDRLWHGELTGYRWWQHLDACPGLLHHDPDLQAMVVTASPGRPADRKDPAAYESAGRLLRELHAVPVEEPVTDWVEETRAALTFESARAARAGHPVDPVLVSRCVAGLERLTRLPVVPTHGDFLPHNWLVDGSGALHTLDFAEAALRPAAHDLARLRFGPCWHRTDLWEAFLHGYGRALTRREERFLGHQLVVNAVTALGWGGSVGRDSVRDRGLEVLAAADRGTGSVPLRPGSRLRRGRGRTR
jgi:hypothetical protein